MLSDLARTHATRVPVVQCVNIGLSNVKFTRRFRARHGYLVLELIGQTLVETQVPSAVVQCWDVGLSNVEIELCNASKMIGTVPAPCRLTVS